MFGMSEFISLSILSTQTGVVSYLAGVESNYFRLPERSSKGNARAGSLASRLTLGFTVILLALSVPSAEAGVFAIEMSNGGGPMISGTVDTTSDTFRIDSWTDSSVSPETKFPKVSELPLTLVALDTDFAGFDVPDDWDGSIGFGQGWGFFLPSGQDLTTVDWEQGPVTNFQGASFGWGGLNNGIGTIVLRGQSTVSYVPKVDGTGLRDIGFADVSITAVPEPTSAFAMALLCLLGIAAGRRAKPAL